MSDPELTPAEEQVRRLLADARHDEPLPGEVADRLDRVLAELQGEDRRTPPPADLAARRRRRAARNLILAAAAVVVVGVGIRTVDPTVLGGQSADDSGSAGSALESAPKDQDDAGGGRADRYLLSLVGPPVVLGSEDFDRQVRRLNGDQYSANAPAAPAPSAANLQSGDAPTTDGTERTGRTWCNDPAWGRGQRVAVRYDGERGVLVLRTPVDDTRQVDLFLCGESAPTRSATVPAG
ncbi:hypothetical protein [Nocardioides conyzicola]|uniref:Uncharacterized protein n=1 Tax=Nocardioides conyzicola TaxID=1651781 RepID=A0ABP8XFV2_9ACTN